MPLSHNGRRMAASLALVGLAALAVAALRKPRRAQRPQAPEHRVKGAARAPVTIVEFSDFQCSSCRAAQAPLKELLGRHPRGIRLVFRHFPVEGVHRWARDAALAAECAGRQGRFWEMHDELFSRQPLWADDDDAPEQMASYAAALGLDRDAFSRCLADPAAAAEIERDKREGLALGINATPTFFVNGKRFVGPAQLKTEGAAEAERALR